MTRSRVLAAAGGAVAATLLGALPAETAPPRREVRERYATPGGVADVITGDTVVQNEHYGAAVVATRRAERTIEVVLADDAGGPVAAEIAQDADGDGTKESTLGVVCGRTAAPLRLRRPGAPVVVYVLAGSCGNGVSAPTTGTVTATLR